MEEKRPRSKANVISSDEMAKHVADNEGLENAWAPLLQKEIAEIFRASL